MRKFIKATALAVGLVLATAGIASACTIDKVTPSGSCTAANTGLWAAHFVVEVGDGDGLDVAPIDGGIRPDFKVAADSDNVLEFDIPASASEGSIKVELTPTKSGQHGSTQTAIAQRGDRCLVKYRISRGMPFLRRTVHYAWGATVDVVLHCGIDKFTVYMSAPGANPTVFSVPAPASKKGAILRVFGPGHQLLAGPVQAPAGGC